MNEEKLLTISIAAYNVEGYIERAISSCLSKDINDLIELLIIDDGSTDRTAQIADDFEKQYPDTVHVIKKQNGGYGSTINTAIPLAHGKYFKLLDGDDWFDNTGLHSLINILQDTNADMILTPFLYISDKNGKKRTSCDMKEVKAGEYPINICLGHLAEIPMHSAAFKTQILKMVDIKLPEHCLYTDTEFVFTALSRINSIFVMHIPVYCYRIARDEQSMSISGLRKHFTDHEIILKNLFEKYDNLPNKESDNAKVMYSMLKRECFAHYRDYCLLQINCKNKRNLEIYDRKLKARKQLYNQLQKDSKIIFCLRKTKFITYPIVCMYVRAKRSY